MVEAVSASILVFVAFYLRFPSRIYPQNPSADLVTGKVTVLDAIATAGGLRDDAKGTAYSYSNT